MAGTLAPFAKPQYFDNNGDPLSGGKLYTYVAGTTTPLATYSDSDLTTPNANPIILDSAGRATIYLAAATYKFVLTTSADVTLWTLDNIAATAAFSVANDITGTAGEALAAGQAVYLSDGSGGLTAGRWYLADADFTYASSLAGVVGIAVAAISAASAGAIRLLGRVTGLSSLVAGTSYYVSATAGALTSTAPANAKFMGVADSSTSLVLQQTPSGIPSLSLANVFTSTTGQSVKKLLLAGSASGTLTVQPPAAASGTLTLPAGTTDLSATGGTNQVVQQTTAGGALTVGAILQALMSIAFETTARLVDGSSGGSWSVGTAGLSMNTTATAGRHAMADWTLMTTSDAVVKGNPSFNCVLNVPTLGTDIQVYVGLGSVTAAAGVLTFTPNHAGFKIIRAASGAVNLSATNADGTTETATALTTVASGDTIELLLQMNGSTSVSYYWRKNGGARSSATTHSTNVPTTSSAVARFITGNANVATDNTVTVYGASYGR